MLIWVKHRTTWASGALAWEWSTFEVAGTRPTKSELAKIKAELEYRFDRAHGWSDKYRGFDWQRATPPVEIVERKIRSLLDDVTEAQRMIDLLTDERSLLTDERY